MCRFCTSVILLARAVALCCCCLPIMTPILQSWFLCAHDMSVPVESFRMPMMVMSTSYRYWRRRWMVWLEFWFEECSTKGRGNYIWLLLLAWLNFVGGLGWLSVMLASFWFGIRSIRYDAKCFTVILFGGWRSTISSLCDDGDWCRMFMIVCMESKYVNLRRAKQLCVSGMIWRMLLYYWRLE